MGLLLCVHVSVSHNGSVALSTCFRESQWVYCSVYVSPFVTVRFRNFASGFLDYKSSQTQPVAECLSDDL